MATGMVVAVVRKWILVRNDVQLSESYGYGTVDNIREGYRLVENLSEDLDILLEHFASSAANSNITVSCHCGAGDRDVDQIHILGGKLTIGNEIPLWWTGTGTKSATWR